MEIWHLSVDITVVLVRVRIRAGLVSHIAPCLWVKAKSKPRPWSFLDSAYEGVPDVRMIEVEGLLRITLRLEA